MLYVFRTGFALDSLGLVAVLLVAWFRTGFVLDSFGLVVVV